jgi:hypothetical protein
MAPVTLGALADKFLRCQYCGHQMDVPDEATIRRVEVVEPHTTPDGWQVTKRTEVTVRRRDLGAETSGNGEPDSDMPAENLAKFVDKVRENMGPEMAADMEKMIARVLPGQAAGEEGEPPASGPDKPGPGKLVEREERREEQRHRVIRSPVIVTRTAPPPRATPAVSIVAIVALVAIIVFAALGAF